MAPAVCCRAAVRARTLGNDPGLSSVSLSSSSEAGATATFGAAVSAHAIPGRRSKWRHQRLGVAVRGCGSQHCHLHFKFLHTWPSKSLLLARLTLRAPRAQNNISHPNPPHYLVTYSRSRTFHRARMRELDGWIHIPPLATSSLPQSQSHFTRYKIERSPVFFFEFQN